MVPIESPVETCSIISKKLSEIISEVSAGTFPYKELRERLIDKIMSIEDPSVQTALSGILSAIVYCQPYRSADEMVYQLRLVEELINSVTGRSDMYVENPFCS